jgi:hypothetical protein
MSHSHFNLVITQVFFMKRSTSLILAFMLLLTPSLSLPTKAQSTDIDSPTPLTSNELNGDISGPTKEVFYSFIANPGEVTMTVDVTSTNSVTALFFYALDNNGATEIMSSYAQASMTGTSNRKIKTMNFATRKKVILKLENYIGQGTFRIRLSGSGAPKYLETGNTPRPENIRMGLPMSGILKFEMSDGTTQEINLDRVQRVLIKPGEK